jgi:hypothetical protein
MQKQKYIIVKDGRIIREADEDKAPYAAHAIIVLKPDINKGERLYVELAIWK